MKWIKIEEIDYKTNTMNFFAWEKMKRYKIPINRSSFTSWIFIFNEYQIKKYFLCAPFHKSYEQSTEVFRKPAGEAGMF
jgi:hypothetical protein